ncbi:hypothetical protein PAMP_014569 [Pampus punctatissimus]
MRSLDGTQSEQLAAFGGTLRFFFFGFNQPAGQQQTDARAQSAEEAYWAASGGVVSPRACREPAVEVRARNLKPPSNIDTDQSTDRESTEEAEEEEEEEEEEGSLPEGRGRKRKRRGDQGGEEEDMAREEDDEIMARGDTGQ